MRKKAVKKAKKPVVKKSIVRKAVDKIRKKPNLIETTNREEFGRLLKEGHVTVEIRSEIKGSSLHPAIPKTYVVKEA